MQWQNVVHSSLRGVTDYDQSLLFGFNRGADQLCIGRVARPPLIDTNLTGHLLQGAGPLSIATQRRRVYANRQSFCHAERTMASSMHPGGLLHGLRSALGLGCFVPLCMCCYFKVCLASCKCSMHMRPARPVMDNVHRFNAACEPDIHENVKKALAAVNYSCGSQPLLSVKLRQAAVHMPAGDEGAA